MLLLIRVYTIIGIIYIVAAQTQFVVHQRLPDYSWQHRWWSTRIRISFIGQVLCKPSKEFNSGLSLVSLLKLKQKHNRINVKQPMCNSRLHKKNMGKYINKLHTHIAKFHGDTKLLHIVDRNSISENSKNKILWIKIVNKNEINQ